MLTYDVAIVGGGPAGSACAALCAEAGLRTLVVEKAIFPREKVCGDCLNPACWPVLERLGVAERVRALPHSVLRAVEFCGTDGRVLRYPLAADAVGEISVKRSALDALLLARAAELGATVRTGVALTRLECGWRLFTSAGEFFARRLVAADGRNSTVARLLGLLPAAQRDRVGLQTHVAAPPDFGAKVTLHLLPQGYCGVASVGAGQLNVCLVGRAPQLPALQAWAAERFPFAPVQEWRTIAPLARRAVPPVHENLLLIGDTARVVEPFTGEGIYYALASGARAAQHLAQDDLAGFAAAHRSLYRGRLWVNRLARFAVTHPELTTQALRVAQHWPKSLRFLTGKVLGPELLALP